MDSRGQRLWLPALLLVSMLVPSWGQACPNGCFCFENFASCSNITGFPRFPSNTKELTLSNSNLSIVAHGPLRALTSLKTLEITSCTLGILGPGAFEGLSNMDYFTISQSSISQIQDGAFSGMSNITSFLLFQNNIGDVQANAFRDLSHMEDLAFKSNKIARIFPNAFNNITHIKDLQFSDNSFGELRTGSFWAIQNISTFVAFQNHVAKVECGTFDVVIPASQTSNFNGNFFNCSCSLSWIFYSPLLESFMHNDCTFPENPDALISLRRVKEADLKCPASAAAMERGCSVLPEFSRTTVDAPSSTKQAPSSVYPTTNGLSPTTPPPSQSPNSGSPGTETTVTSSNMATTSKPEAGGLSPATEAGSTEVTGSGTGEASDRPLTVAGQSSSSKPSTVPTSKAATDRQPEETEKQATSGPRGAAASRDRAGSVGRIVVLLSVVALLLHE